MKTIPLVSVIVCMIIQSLRTELEMQYETLRRDIEKRSRIARFAHQAFRHQALILESDRDPADVVLRRTTALLEDIKRMPSAPQTAAIEEQLKRLQTLAKEVPVVQGDDRFELFKKACKLRRKIAFSNPLLDFDEILFIKRHRSGFSHMCDQYYGINTKPGGGLYVLRDPFAPNPQVRDVLADSIVQKGRLRGQKLEDGSFLSPDLSYDGRSIVFAYVECKGDTAHRHHTDPSKGHWYEQRCYHVFRVNVDGTGLEQLTDGTWNDFDPCWLPNGRVHFTVPARKELFFQALDEKGLAVQSMRSATYLQPGERLVCQGCHGPRHRAPEAPQHVPLALKRDPSEFAAVPSPLDKRIRPRA